MTAFAKNILWISLIFNVLAVGIGWWAVQRLGGWDATFYRLRHKGLSGIYENRKSLFGVLKGTHKDIIWLGDSLTEKGEWSELFGDSRHKNRGISGDYAAGVLARLDVILDKKPAAIFLMVGTNDILMGMKPQVVLGYVEQIVAKIRQESPTTRVVLQSVPPINTRKWVLPPKNADLLKYNDLLQNFAQAESLEYINLHEKLVDKSGLLDERYTHDGIHLTGQAYLIWKETLNPVVEQL